MQFVCVFHDTAHLFLCLFRIIELLEIIKEADFFC